MKSYEEVTKDVLQQSEDIIKNKTKKRRRIMTAVKTSIACITLAGALVIGVWITGNQGGDIVLTPFDATNTVNTEFTGYFSDWSTDKGILTNMWRTDEPVDTSFFEYDDDPIFSENTGPDEISGEIVSGTVNPSDRPPATTPTDPWNFPPGSHYHEIINCKMADKLDPSIPPKNGTVYISKELKHNLDFYGDSYGDGCRVPYYVEFAYYKDGELIDPAETLYYSEQNRLKDFLSEIKDSIPDCFIYGCYTDSQDREEKTEFIYGMLYKSQVENYPANENYGIVIRLNDHYPGVMVVENKE